MCSGLGIFVWVLGVELSSVCLRGSHLPSGITPVLPSQLWRGVGGCGSQQFSPSVASLAYGDETSLSSGKKKRVSPSAIENQELP